MDSAIKILKLDNNNYQIWKYKLELLLLKEGLLELVISDLPARDARNNEWLRRDGQARAFIGLSLEDSQLIHVRNFNTAKECWDSLRRYHEQQTVTNRVFILKRLCRMRLEENGDMEIHVNEMYQLFQRFAAGGEAVPEDFVVALMLCSLPESYNALITALESRPLAELRIEFVKGKLISEYRRRVETQRGESAGSSESALKVQNGGYKNKKCFNCGLKGHFKKDCYKLKLNNGRWQNNSIKQKANKTVDESVVSSSNKNCESDDKFCCFSVNKEHSSVQWYIDSAATCHMSNDIKFFDKLKQCMITVQLFWLTEAN